MTNMINDCFSKINEVKTQFEDMKSNVITQIQKEIDQFKIGMAEDMIALEKKINKNNEVQKRDVGKLKERIALKFKDFKKKIDDNHDLVLKRFAKEK